MILGCIKLTVKPANPDVFTSYIVVVTSYLWLLGIGTVASDMEFDSVLV